MRQKGNLGALVVLLALGLCTTKAHAQTTLIFNYTGALDTFMIPAGVTSLTVKLWGGGGGVAGGSGAFVTGNLSVTPGTLLTVLVAGGGSHSTSMGGFGGGANSNGRGAGGGRSAIRLSTDMIAISDELVTAAGGGGGGARVDMSFDPMMGSIATTTYFGGGEGGLVAGGMSSFGGGGGGTQTSGGAGGFGGTPGENGSRFQGGSGAVGGGGGYFGGGGTGHLPFTINTNGAAGGGSSFLDNLTSSGASEAGLPGLTTGTAPGGTSDPDYSPGIGNGGSSGSSGGNGRIVISFNPAVSSAPEPSTICLLMLGATQFILRRKKKK